MSAAAVQHQPSLPSILRPPPGSSDYPNAGGVSRTSPRGPAQPPLHHIASNSHRPIRVRIYCNGDRHFNGKQVNILASRYMSFGDLLGDLTGQLPNSVLLAYGVRQIFTPNSGRRIKKISQLKDGGDYVCAGFETFKPMKYGDSNPLLLDFGDRQQPRVAGYGDIGSGERAAGDPVVGNGNGNTRPANFSRRLSQFNRRNQQQQQLPVVGNRRPGVNRGSLVPLNTSNTTPPSWAPGGEERTTDTIVGPTAGSVQTNSQVPVGAYQRQRVLTIVRAGGTRRPREKVRFFVNRQTFRTYDQFARAIADNFFDKRRSSTTSQTDWYGSGAAKNGVGIRLFSIGGREVVGVSDLFKDDDLFVGVPAGVGEPTTAEIRDLVEEIYPGSPYVDVLLRKWTKARRRSNRMYGNAFAAQQAALATVSDETEQQRSAVDGDQIPEENAADLRATDKPAVTDDSHREITASTTGIDNTAVESRAGDVTRGARYPASKLPRSRRSRRSSRASDTSSSTGQVETTSDARLESIREDAYETSRQRFQGASQNRNQYPAANDGGYTDPRLKGRNPHVLIARRRLQHRLPPIQASSEQPDQPNSDENKSVPPSSERKVRLEYRKRQSGNENMPTGDLPPRVPNSSFVADETIAKAPNEPASSPSRKSLEDVSNKKLSSGEEMEPVKKTRRNKDDKTKKGQPDVTHSTDQTDGSSGTVKDENGNILKTLNDGESSQNAPGNNVKTEQDTAPGPPADSTSSLPPIFPQSKTGGQRRVSRDSIGHSAKPIFRTKMERQVSRIERVMDLYELGKVLGDGNFAIVRHCRHKTSGKEYAMKVVDKSKMRGKEAMIENEIAITKACKHPNIVRLYEEYETKTEIYLVMELVKGGDLFDTITQSVKFGEPDAARMIADLTNALFYLHSLDIVHRDLKPENVLVHRNRDGGITLKLGDFGLAMEVHEPIYTICGTPTYVAPEILSQSGYGLEIDMWALGVILYILLCGFPPFRSAERRQTELFQSIKAGTFEFLSPYWDDISKMAKKLISRLLVVNVRKRFKAIDVLCDPFITTVGGSTSIDQTDNYTEKLRADLEAKAKQYRISFNYAALKHG